MLCTLIGAIILFINIQVGLNMHLYDDIGDASSSLQWFICNSFSNASNLELISYNTTSASPFIICYFQFDFSDDESLRGNAKKTSEGKRRNKSKASKNTSQETKKQKEAKQVTNKSTIPKGGKQDTTKTDKKDTDKKQKIEGDKKDSNNPSKKDKANVAKKKGQEDSK